MTMKLASTPSSSLPSASSMLLQLLSFTSSLQTVQLTLKNRIDHPSWSACNFLHSPSTRVIIEPVNMCLLRNGCTIPLSLHGVLSSNNNKNSDEDNNNEYEDDDDEEDDNK